MGYVSGLIVMDETGFVLSDYHRTGEAPRQLGEYLIPPRCWTRRFTPKALRHALCLRGREHD